MNLGQLISQFRLDTLDEAAKYGWSKDEIIGYANESVDEACRRARLLVDSSSIASDASLGVDESEVELHDSVIYVRRVRIVGGSVLRPCVTADMDERVPGWEDSTSSTPIIFVPDWESGKLKVWPPASTSIDLKLTVVRIPLNEMEVDDDEPEIPSRYHRALLEYMKHIAYQKQDIDTMDADKSLKFEERFAGEFGPAVSAQTNGGRLSSITT